MNKTEWPEECPLVIPSGIDIRKKLIEGPPPPHWALESLTPTALEEIRRRWRLAPVAEALSKAVDGYLKARHNNTEALDPRVIEAEVVLLNAQHAFEKATRP